MMAVLAAIALSQAPSAQNAAIKLATVVPDGSIWDKSLKQMGADWSKATAGRVSLTEYGSEAHARRILANLLAKGQWRRV